MLEENVMAELVVCPHRLCQWTVVDEPLEQEGKCLLIAGPGTPCKFLDDENRCDIYPTRPNVCVAMAAGDEQCQQARKGMGIDPLEPVD